MAVSDALYRFILVDIGDVGRHSDGGVLINSGFGKALKMAPLLCLKNAGTVLPYGVGSQKSSWLKTSLSGPWYKLFFFKIIIAWAI